MNQFKVSLIDKSLSEKELQKLISLHTFEDISEVLREVLGPDYFVYEGNNHIDVHKIGDGRRLVFIEKN